MNKFSWLYSGYKDHSRIQKLTTHIKVKSQQLSHHEIYSYLTSSDRIKCFISYYISAVWDFVELLKYLQSKLYIALRGQFLECPSEIKRLINDVVFTEESELYPYGQPSEDFAIYLHVLTEIEVDPDCLWQFLELQVNLDLLSRPGIKELVEFNLTVAKSGTIPEMLAAYFFGREKLNVQLLTSTIEVLKQSGKECVILTNYAKKLSQSNRPESELIALKLIDYLCQDEEEKIEALQVGLVALALREKLWDYALADIAET